MLPRVTCDQARSVTSGHLLGQRQGKLAGPFLPVLGCPLPFLQEPTGEGHQALSVCPQGLQKRHGSGPQATSCSPLHRC